MGGGTPSLMSPEQLDYVLNVLKQYSKITNDTEVCLEMDPGTFDSNKVKDYKSIGVSRLSMGVQTL